MTGPRAVCDAVPLTRPTVSGLCEAVERFRVVDQDAVSGALSGPAHRRPIEQHASFGLCALASVGCGQSLPQAGALRGGVDEGLGHLGRIRITGGADLVSR